MPSKWRSYRNHIFYDVISPYVLALKLNTLKLKLLILVSVKRTAIELISMPSPLFGNSCTNSLLVWYDLLCLASLQWSEQFNIRPHCHRAQIDQLYLSGRATEYLPLLGSARVRHQMIGSAVSAGLTSVPNTETDVQTTERATGVATGYIYLYKILLQSVKCVGVIYGYIYATVAKRPSNYNYLFYSAMRTDFPISMRQRHRLRAWGGARERRRRQGGLARYGVPDLSHCSAQPRLTTRGA